MTEEEIFEEITRRIERLQDIYNDALEEIINECRAEKKVTHENFVEIYRTVKSNKICGSWADPKIGER